VNGEVLEKIERGVPGFKRRGVRGALRATGRQRVLHRGGQQIIPAGLGGGRVARSVLRNFWQRGEEAREKNYGY